ncbi:peptidoglycan-binding domain 1 protein [Candidatus Magnetomorum sp. HK-1]|nr:peptidoglycan-binding domain 1 protein [Candidatus Magnetomorum sp. HK-1]
MAINNRTYSHSIIYSALKRAVEQYGTFITENEKVNIIGIRGLTAEQAPDNKYTLNSHELWFNPVKYPIHLGCKFKISSDYNGSKSNPITNIEVSGLNIKNKNIWPAVITVYINDVSHEIRIINNSTIQFLQPIESNLSQNTEITYYGYQADNYDDTIAVAFKKNNKYMVKLYSMTTERGINEKRSTYLNFGSTIIFDSHQYSYTKGVHASKYKALNPCVEKDVVYDWDKKAFSAIIGSNKHINIHFGDLFKSGDIETYSLGCQVIYQESNFKDFMKFFGYKNIYTGTKLLDTEIEEDKVKDDESETYYYTLINVDDFEKFLTPICLPLAEKSMLSKETLDLYYNTLTESLNYFPISTYGWWHNGIHISGNDGDEICAIADGRIIYASIAQEEHPELGSPNFLLLQHELPVDDKIVIFYSMYMHLKKINIQPEIENSSKIPNWIQNKFYYNKGIVKKDYPNADGTRSLTVFKSKSLNSEHLDELKINDAFQTLESPSGNYVKVRTLSNIEGFLFISNNCVDISKKCLYEWGIENEQIKERIFKKPIFFENPVSVSMGETIGYIDRGVENIQIFTHSKPIVQTARFFHFEIFSKREDNIEAIIQNWLAGVFQTAKNNYTNEKKDLYNYLSAKPEGYFLLEDNDSDDIAEPVIQRINNFNMLNKQCQHFSTHLNQMFPGTFPIQNNDYSYMFQIVLKPEEVNKYMEQNKVSYQSCVAIHKSTWQTVEKSMSYVDPHINESLKNLDAFHLFQTNEKYCILKENEKLFFYHPIKLIEVISDLFSSKDNKNKALHEAAPIKEDTDCIQRLKKTGVVNNKDFRPDDPVKRSEFLKMLLVSLDYSIPPQKNVTTDFTDVDKNAWFVPYIYTANLCKIAQGYRTEDGKQTYHFGPIDDTTVDQALKMLSVAKYGAEKAKKDDYDINGQKSGTQVVTREQAATLICKLLDDDESEQHVTKRRDALIRRITGPVQGEVDKKLVYRVIKFAGNITKEQKDNINWIIKDEHNGNIIHSFKKNGEQLEYTPKSELRQKTFRVIAYTNKISLEASIRTDIDVLQFYVVDNGQKKFVSYNDVANKDHHSSKIYAYQNGKSKLFAIIVKYKTRYGLATKDNGHDRPRLSVSDFSDSKHKVAVAVSRNEGSFVDTHSWDSGIITHGTIQWTLSSGNLQVLLTNYKTKQFDLFNEYFISHGIDIVDNCISIDGKNLDKGKASLRLAYYLWKSGYEKEFQKLQIERMLLRLGSCYPNHWAFKDISKYFTSENSVAHLFDLNVNRSGYVADVAQLAVKKFNKNFPNKKDTAKWTDENESQFITFFLDIRKNYGKIPMTDSEKRAENINNISSLSTKRNSYNG